MTSKNQFNGKMDLTVWIVQCSSSSGLLFFDENKKYWLGGQPSLIYLPIFVNKKDALRTAKHFRDSAFARKNHLSVWITKGRLD